MACKFLSYCEVKTLIAILYSIFAAISIAANIITQFIAFTIYNGTFSIYIAMATGTLTGLITKYTLDKKYIFKFKAKDYMENLATFIAYSFMGVFTTFIFWGTELAFNWLFKSPEAKYIGAFIGLCIGYYTKYHLDKRFVFRKSYAHS